MKPLLVTTAITVAPADHLAALDYSGARPDQLTLPILALLRGPQTVEARRAARFRKRAGGEQQTIQWTPRIDRNTLVLKYTPVARAVAARAFKACRGYSQTLGLQGRGPGGLLPYLQAEAADALVRAGQEYDPARLNPKTQQPVSFAPYARSHVKWRIHYVLKNGDGAPRTAAPLDLTLDGPRRDRLIDAAGHGDEMDPGEAAEIRALFAALPAELQRAAVALEAGADVSDEHREALQDALWDYAQESAAPRSAPQRIRPARIAEDIDRAPLVEAQALVTRRGGVSLW